MTNNNKNITGNFGGGGRQPTRDPDTLNITETGKVVEILSEGITEGFATPSKEFAKGTVINNYNQIQEIYSLSGALQDQYIAFAHEDIFLDEGIRINRIQAKFLVELLRKQTIRKKEINSLL